jgi:hypothetical protein
MDNYIEKFDVAKTSTNEITHLLENMVITDHDTRNDAYEACKQANALKNEVDEKRLELLRPIAAEKKSMKADHKKELEPLDELKKQIEEYANDNLIGPLNKAIAIRKQTIIAWDDKIKREEAERLAEIERKRVEAERKHIEDLKKTEEKTGIAKEIAQEKADQKVEESKVDLEQEKEDLLSKKSGRQKEVIRHELDNIHMVPEEYLKPREVDWVKVKAAGFKQIPGFNVFKEKELMFK